ncbi:MAG TPA: hypothetical protein VGX28_12450 [Frankiaceae bacterium]|jgi:hypothetical protein|nr:hypothetical protein [Frankiaceae bacterium]
MATILPDAPPPRSPLAAARFALPGPRVVAYVLAVLVAGLALAAGARAWTGRVPAADEPGGRQRPLTTWASLPASDTMPAFRIELPEQPHTLAAPTGESPTILSSYLGGEAGARGVLLLVRFDGVASARESIDGIGGGRLDVGPVRRVSVAGRPAYTRDMAVGERVVHEYRFEVDGRVYGFGILCDSGDDACRDTGLAAMATFEIG